eukprot:980429_1
MNMLVILIKVLLILHAGDTAIANAMKNPDVEIRKAMVKKYAQQLRLVRSREIVANYFEQFHAWRDKPNHQKSDKDSLQSDDASYRPLLGFRSQESLPLIFVTTPDRILTIGYFPSYVLWIFMHV